MKPQETMDELMKLAAKEMKKAFVGLHDAVNTVNAICPSSERNLTICHGRKHDVSRIVLTGKWLSHAGFVPGLSIRLTVRKELIIISSEDESKQKWIKKSRLIL